MGLVRGSQWVVWGGLAALLCAGLAESRSRRQSGAGSPWCTRYTGRAGCRTRRLRSKWDGWMPSVKARHVGVRAIPASVIPTRLGP